MIKCVSPTFNIIVFSLIRPECIILSKKESTKIRMKLSRHVKNNMRLYGIKEDDILNTVESPDKTYKEENKIVAIKSFLGRFSGYPLKVVYDNIGETNFFVITAYPLKRKDWR
ncbi:MAG: DUF4258 domain-containing protein [Nitrospinota bacterium]